MTEGWRKRPGARRGAGWRRALVATAWLIVAPLAACERQAYDAPSGAVAPPAPPPPALAGAPAAPPPQPAPAYAGPPAMEAPSAAPDPYAAAPPSAAAPSAIVAMEPIPNPPEAATLHLRHRAHAHSAAAPLPQRADGRRRTARPTHALGFGKASKPAKAAKAPRAASAAPETTTGDRSRNVADLQSVLADAVQKTATLSAATPLTSDKPIAVTLTLPADFADTVRTESGRRGLSDAAASVNVSARLSGDDYKALPEDAQIQPLLSGQPTRFHWTVIGQGAGRGPLHADVKAQLLGGGGDALDLGSVSASGPHTGIWRAVGVLLLALVGLAIVAALGRRKARARARVVVNRPMPFDMDRTG